MGLPEAGSTEGRERNTDGHVNETCNGTTEWREKCMKAGT
jgi:hypothetical protein